MIYARTWFSDISRFKEKIKDSKQDGKTRTIAQHQYIVIAKTELFTGYVQEYFV